MGRHGTGSIRERNGKWEARYYDPDGRQRSKTFTRKSDAQRHINEQQIRKERGTWRDPSLDELTFHEVATRWRRSLVDLKPATLAGYDSVMRLHVIPEFGRERIGKITTDRVQRWVAELDAGDRLAASSIRRVFQVVTAVMNYATEHRLLRTTPTDGVRLPVPEDKERDVLTPDQIAAVAAAIGEPYDTLILTAAYCGLRMGECGALRVGRVDTTAGTLTVAETVADVNGAKVFGTPKGGKARRVSLPPTLADRLHDHVVVHTDGEPGTLMWQAPQGGPLTSATFHGHWRAATVAALPERLHGVRFHDLRHTCAALMIEQGVHPKAIQKRLGHASIRITMDVYGHLLDSVDQGVTDALDGLLAQTT